MNGKPRQRPSGAMSASSGSGSDGRRDVGSSLRAEHAAVARCIHDCRHLLAGEFGWDSARVVLTRLREELERHFGFEENDGYLEEVIARAPEQAAVVAKLAGDHSRMRAEMTLLLAASLVARSRADLRQRLEAFLDGLADHERRENELVQVVLGTDVGAGD